MNIETKALENATEDPFLELAIASETTTDYKTLLQIAKSAAATSEASMKTTIDPQILAHFAMVAPSTTEKSTIVKKQYFMESSDNDLGGKYKIIEVKKYCECHIIINSGMCTR